MVFRASLATLPGKGKSYNSNNFYLNSKSLSEDISAEPILMNQKHDQSGFQMYAISEGYGAENFQDEISGVAIDTIRKVHVEITTLLDKMKEDGKQHGGLNLAVIAEKCVKEANKKAIGKANTFEIPDKHIASLALLFISGKRVASINAGDTKVLFYRAGTIRQISEDHTQAAHLAKLQLITDEQALFHPKRHKLTQYLGVRSENDTFSPTFFEFSVMPDDLILIVSRAFYEGITKDKMIEIIKKNHDTESIVNELMSEVADSDMLEDTSVIAIMAKDDECKIDPAPVVEAVASVGVASEKVDATDKAGETAFEDYNVGDFAINTDAQADNSKDESNGLNNDSIDLAKPKTFEKENKASTQDEQTEHSESVAQRLSSFMGVENESADDKKRFSISALLVGLLCLVIIALFVALGVKLYNSKNEDTNKPAEIIETDGPASTEPIETPVASTEPTSTGEPVASPTTAPTTKPTTAPTTKPTSTDAPTQGPTTEPTSTDAPTEGPTTEPTGTEEPTQGPTTEPTSTDAPTEGPTTEPTGTEEPTQGPTTEPTSTDAPTQGPTTEPTSTDAPTEAPTTAPTETPGPTPV